MVNIGYCEGFFVDLGIIIEYKKNNIQLYDKRDSFQFSIVRTSPITGETLEKCVILHLEQRYLEQIHLSIIVKKFGKHL